ncbi:Uncharacterised protein [Streptococcus pneumoniae]|nr:Uncharacterised protein [Streptococcus pneumoniae]
MICCSIGRLPIAQPPGNATIACPKRANKGPITKILARILLTYSYGASSFNVLVASTTTAFSSFLYVTSAFNVDNTLLIVSTSLNAGTLTNLLVPLEAKSEAVNTGKTAFLAPSTLTSPFNWLPPLITILSILNPPLKSPSYLHFPTI